MKKVPSLAVDQQDAENLGRIEQVRRALGKRLVILGHYQRLSIALQSDHLGDSYGLCVRAARSREAKYIVFCGVEFMAESAEILRADGQIVYHPNAGAGCPMADMVEIDDLESAYRLAEQATGKKVVPVTYMNSSSEVKAFCGRMGGLVCTSSNAEKAFEWAFNRGELLLFVPDEHLGTNTADRIGIPEAARALFDPNCALEENRERIRGETRLLLWRGYCHVHTWFTPDEILQARVDHPDARIVVHPECPREVVALADEAGSTAFMHQYARDAPDASTTIIGTEVNLVEYLRHRYGDGKTILPLSRSFCPNMFKINLQNLADTLEHLTSDRFMVRVDAHIKKDARLALERMLDIA